MGSRLTLKACSRAFLHPYQYCHPRKWSSIEDVYKYGEGLVQTKADNCQSTPCGCTLVFLLHCFIIKTNSFCRRFKPNIYEQSSTVSHITSRVVTAMAPQ